MSTLFGQPDPQGDDPIRDAGDLTLFFRAGEKPADRVGIGVEFERLPVERRTGRAVPYAAAGTGPSIERFLETLAGRHGWTPLLESGRVVALERGTSRVTLEPGAQLELSGGVHPSAAGAAAEIETFVRETDAVASESGLVFLGLGSQPFTEPSEIGWVPKGRYRIMAPWLARRGHLAHSMMKGTAGCQFNLDYLSEQDAMEKLRLAMAATSVVTALCANSPLARGQACGFLTRRAQIWLHTDPDRCGLLRFALEEGRGYADYAEWALDVPMLFVVRDGSWVDMTGRTFRGYLAGDNRGLTPSHADWELHLTTLFPEVRLKRYIEVRGSDSAGMRTVGALAAFWQGLLYDAGARRRGWAAVGRFSWAERTEFHRRLVREGLAARLGGVPALELARELLDAAGDGLPSSCRPLLAPLRHLAFDEGRTAAERLLERWRGPLRRDPARFVEACAAGADGAAY